MSVIKKTESTGTLRSWAQRHEWMLNSANLQAVSVNESGFCSKRSSSDVMVDSQRERVGLLYGTLDMKSKYPEIYENFWK